MAFLCWDGKIVPNHDPKKIIQAILLEGAKLTRDVEKLKSIAELSGIYVNNSFQILGMEVDAATARERLLKNLAAFPVIQLAAQKLIMEKEGL